ncbi:MAG: pentapeptide repeat-containing protein [Pirellulales bacterium]
MKRFDGRALRRHSATKCLPGLALASAPLLLLLFAELASAGTPAIELGLNLISNPGAEIGSRLSDGMIQLDDWTVTSGPLGADGLTGVAWGQPGGFPTFADPGPQPTSTRGTYFFAGGNNEHSSATQTIAGMAPEVQSAIDGGRVPFNLNGWLGGYTFPGDWQNDNARLTVRFLDDSHQVINTAAIGPVTDADRDHRTGLLYRDAIGFVPAGTRSIGVDLEMTRFGGSYNDGYADNLSLTLFPPLPPSAPTPYSFTNILDSSVPAPNGNYLNIRDAAVSGNRVAFKAAYNQGFLGDLDSIYISSGGPRAQVVERLNFAPNDDRSYGRPPEGGRLDTIGRPAIDGRVVYFDSRVFYPDFRYGTGIFFGDGTRYQNAPSIATALSPHAGPQFAAYQTVADPQVSNRYIAYRKSSGENSALDTLRVLTPERTSSTLIAGVGSPTPLGGTFDWIDPNFDLSGPTVAFRGITGSEEGIFTGAGGELSTIVKKGDATPLGGYFDAVLDPTITGNTVAFVGTFAGGSGIFTGDGGALATIVKTGDTTQDGKVFTGLSTPTLAFNMIAFRGEYSGGSGLYTKRGDELSKVVEIGDAMFGSTVTSFSFSDLGLDVGGSGNLAFTFGLADGRTGVAMATLDAGLPTIFQDAAGRVPVPDSVGITWVPAADFSGRNLTKAWLLATDLQNLNGRNVNLRNAVLRGADLTNADLSGADLRGAVLDTARLSGANLSGAQVRGARFGREYLAVLDSCWVIGCGPPSAVGYGGITTAQLSSTASYQAHDLAGINLSGNDLSNLSLAGQNLSGANFEMATLSGVDFTDAEIRRANFGRYPISATMSDCAYGRCTGWTGILGTGITLEQLTSTRSYLARDLNGISFRGNDVAGGNFANFNLANTNFSAAVLTDANFSGAEVRGANFSVDIDTPPYGTGITAAQLYSTANYQARNLSGIALEHNNLTQWNFAGQDLTNASFRGAALAGADFSGAEIRGAVLSGDARRVRYGDVFEGVVIRGIIVYGSGVKPAQLYSTASYQAHDLRGVGLDFNDFTSANLAGQNLSNARFYGATLAGADLSRANLSGAAFGADDFARVGPLSALPTSQDLIPADLSGANLAGANLTNANFSGLRLCDAQGCDEFLGANLTGANLKGADARGANFLLAVLQGANTANLIQSDGHIAGLDLRDGAMLTVRDYDANPAGGVVPASGPLPIVVDQHLTMDSAGMLQFVLEADSWNSTISFASGVEVTRAGRLELLFADETNAAGQIGRTFKLFDWTGVNPTGTFSVVSPYRWDLSHLYSTGAVTLLAVPEPSTLVLCLALATLSCSILRPQRPTR